MNWTLSTDFVINKLIIISIHPSFLTGGAEFQHWVLISATKSFCYLRILVYIWASRPISALCGQIFYFYLKIQANEKRMKIWEHGVQKPPPPGKWCFSFFLTGSITLFTYIQHVCASLSCTPVNTPGVDVIHQLLQVFCCVFSKCLYLCGSGTELCVFAVILSWSPSSPSTLTRPTASASSLTPRGSTLPQEVPMPWSACGTWRNWCASAASLGQSVRVAWYYYSAWVSPVCWLWISSQAGLACEDTELQPRWQNVGFGLWGSLHWHCRGGNRSVQQATGCCIALSVSLLTLEIWIVRVILFFKEGFQPRRLKKVVITCCFLLAVPRWMFFCFYVKGIWHLFQARNFGRCSVTLPPLLSPGTPRGRCWPTPAMTRRANTTTTGRQALSNCLAFPMTPETDQLMGSMSQTWGKEASQGKSWHAS